MRKVIMAAVLLSFLHSPARAGSPVIVPNGHNPLVVNGNEAVALTRKTFETQMNNRTMTLTWYWKQTWRKTAQGWKLATSQRDAGNFDRMQGLTFTFVPQAKDLMLPSKVK